MKKHSALIDLIKLLKDTYKYLHLHVPATAKKMNKGVFTDGKWVPTQHAILATDNLISELWTHMKPAFATLNHSAHSYAI